MDYSRIAGTELFAGATPAETESMLGCLGAEQRDYPRGSVLYRMGEPVTSLGLVLSGSVNIESIDLWGNRSILDSIGPGQVFAETYTCLPQEPLMVDVTAAEDCRVLFLGTARILQTCPSACAHHSRLIRNLMAISARKNLALSRKILHTTPKTIRGRLISYLSFQAAQQGGRRFDIPFNRQQLADYLGVDRSALSGELSRMQADGLLTFRKNHFELRELDWRP